MPDETHETHGPGWDDYERAKREGRPLSSLVAPKPDDETPAEPADGDETEDQ